MLDLLAIDWRNPGLWCILWLLQGQVLVFVECFRYAFWRRYVNMSILVVPIDFEPTVVSPTLVDFYGVMFSEGR